MKLFAVLPIISVVFFLAILLFIEIGRRVGTTFLQKDPDGARTGIGAIEGAVFGLLGLLLAFTFSGAAARMDARRDLIVQETNVIGTAWLRLDLLPPETQPELRQLFRDYVDTRLAYYKELQNPANAAAHNARASALQGVIWKKSVAATQQLANPTPGISTLRTMNDMIDITTTRAVALDTHPPTAIYYMLAILILISGLLIGFGTAGSAARNWFHTMSYAVVMVSALYLIVDFEFPRMGSIRIDHIDQILVDLRKSLI